MTDAPRLPVLSRRALLAGSATAAAALGTSAARAQDAQPAAPAHGPVTEMTPDEALSLLKDGNEAFLAGNVADPDLSAQRRLELAEGQSPFVAYISCSDSRVPPELLFGRGLGELFIIRNAGNTLDTVAMGSVEYAVAQLKVPLVVVMGHESCGAVKAAMAVVEENATFPGSIDDMIEPIIPAVLAVRGHDGDYTENSVKQNVRHVVQELRAESDPLLLEPQAAGKLKVVGAYYELATGRVQFFDEA